MLCQKEKIKKKNPEFYPGVHQNAGNVIKTAKEIFLSYLFFINSSSSLYALYQNCVTTLYSPLTLAY